MTSADAARFERLRAVVDSAQKVAGALAACHRGDRADAAAVLAGFDDDRELAGGALLVAELSLGLAAHAGDREVEDVVRELCLQMEGSLGSRA